MDLAARRREFPALEATPRLAYLDSAATTLVPRAVIDAVAHALATAGNPGRGVHARAEAASAIVDDARAEAARFVGGAPAEIVLTSGTTAALNLLADTAAELLTTGDEILSSAEEHHANHLPWQRLGKRVRARFAVVPMAELIARISPRTRIVAVAHVSNVLGSVAPIADIARAAHAVGAKLYVDGAQAVAHLPVDVAALGCDAYAFSAHKVYGPQGVGVLWARASLLAELPAWQLGGGMVGREPPARFEAGTPNTPGLAGLAAALRWFRGLDHAQLAADEAHVHSALRGVIADAGGRVLGDPVAGVVSFTWDYHPHDIATILAAEGVAVRSGHHCAQPLHARLALTASTRASVGCYSSLDDVAQLARGLATVRATLGAR